MIATLTLKVYATDALLEDPIELERVVRQCWNDELEEAIDYAISHGGLAKMFKEEKEEDK